MMKILLLIFYTMLMGASYTAHSKTNDTPTEAYIQSYTVILDANFEQALIAQGLDDVLDGQVLTANIANIIYLDLNGKNISDLTGLSDFTALEVLKIAYNDLSTVDLNTLTNLQEVFCNNSHINNLNISNCVNLIQLDCFNNNLTSLDLSGNPVLESLKSYNNSLSSLDISNKPYLSFVQSASNNLTSINIQNTPALNVLHIYNNSFTELILPATTGLSELRCDQNYIANLDVTAVGTLTDLTGFANQIEMINLDHNPNLVSIKLSGNNLNTVSIKNTNNTAISTLWLQSNPNLTCIEVDNPNYFEALITGIIIDPIASFDTQCSSSDNYISILDVNFEQALIDEGVDSEAIIDGQVLQSDVENVVYLDVNSKNILDLSGIEAFTNLETLFAHNNALTSVDLSANEMLNSLSLDYNNLSVIDLSQNFNLAVLSISYNTINQLDLSNNLGLTQLYASHNQISAYDFSLNYSLQEIDVSHNNMAQLDLSQNFDLTKLYCNDNDLVSLNVRNSNNYSVLGEYFNASNNPNLSCIEVDDIAYSTNHWNQINGVSYFGQDCAPENDDCDFAIPITIGLETVSGSNISATSSYNYDPMCQQNDIVVFDVWYQFEAPESGEVSISLNAGPLVGKIALYENCLATNVLICGEANMLEVTDLIPSQTYFMQVWLELNGSGRNTLAATDNSNLGNFTLNVQDASTLSTGETTAEIEFRFWPNPAKDNIKIIAMTPIDRVKVYNIRGNKVIDIVYPEANNIQLKGLSKGLYILEIETAKTSVIKKLILK